MASLNNKQQEKLANATIADLEFNLLTNDGQGVEFKKQALELLITLRIKEYAASLHQSPQ